MSETGSRNLSPAELADLLRTRKINLVDVREPAEFAAMHIDGAALHPLSQFDPALLPREDVVFYCGSGKRSLSALAQCAAAGLPHFSHLTGGIAAWMAAGLPVTRT